MLRDRGENPIGAILDACSGFAGKLLFATRIHARTHTPLSPRPLSRPLLSRREEEEERRRKHRRRKAVFASSSDGLEEEAHENFMRRLNRVYRGPPPRPRLNFKESDSLSRFSRDLTTGCSPSQLNGRIQSNDFFHPIFRPRSNKNKDNNFESSFATILVHALIACV